MKLGRTFLLFFAAAIFAHVVFDCAGTRSEAQTEAAARGHMLYALDLMGQIREEYLLGPSRREDLDTEGFRAYEYRTVELAGYPQETLHIFASKYCCLKSIPGDKKRWQSEQIHFSRNGETWLELSWLSSNKNPVSAPPAPAQ